jgi:hypothetical protein
MKTLTDFIRESEDQVLPPEETKKSLLALISSNFFRFANSEKNRYTFFINAYCGFRYSERR